ncbi:MAG: lytic transglycosylase domain-containing protein [Desulfamplus sp.]|nr:lytic transglycosylase domain-containing protein [Desulfamplus sp.]
MTPIKYKCAQITYLRLLNTPDTLKERIKVQAANFGLDPAIVYGICKQESGLNSAAVRFEPHYKWLFKPESVRPKICSVDTETVLQKTSFGLMQVMGAVFREYGYSDWLSVLPSSPETQLHYGCKHLSNLKRRFPKDNDYISAYNQGSPRKKTDRTYENQHYVDNVLKYSKKWDDIV